MKYCFTVPEDEKSGIVCVAGQFLRRLVSHWHLDEDEQPRRQSVGERQNDVRRQRKEEPQRLQEKGLRVERRGAGAVRADNGLQA